VEHPYGTIKRQWGFSYILTKKGVERAASDVGFMFIAYNLRRIANILSPDVLKEYLRILLSSLLRKLKLTWLKNSHYGVSLLQSALWHEYLQGALVKA
jgi:hypothetical protein